MSDGPIRIRISKGKASSNVWDVTDVSTGREIICESARLDMSASNIPKLTITVFDFEVDVHGLDTSAFRDRSKP